MTWTGRGYQAQASGYGAPRRLRLVEIRKQALAPGRYRFYYLPASGVVLSAESLGDDEGMVLPTLARLDSAPEAPSDLRSVLAAVFDHDVQAFESNRIGLLDPAQAQKLRQRSVRTAIMGVLLAVVPWVVIYYGFGVDNLVVVGFAGMFSLFGLFSLRSAARYTAEARAGRVEVLEGVVTSIMRRKSDGESQSTHYYYCVASEDRLGDQEFSVDQKAYNALVDGLRYRLYVTPRSRTLIGIEPVGEAGSGEREAAW